jgi:hypothetical protein
VFTGEYGLDGINRQKGDMHYCSGSVGSASFLPIVANGFEGYCHEDAEHNQRGSWGVWWPEAGTLHFGTFGHDGCGGYPDQASIGIRCTRRSAEGKAPEGFGRLLNPG